MKSFKNFKVVRKIRKLSNLKDYINRSHYLEYVQNNTIDDEAVLLECQHGTGINGNVFYLLKELCTQPQYQHLKIYLSYNPKYIKEIKNILDAYPFEKYELVNMKSDKYYKVISSAKYLINDNTFLPFFIKREEQVYVNTWHGTPLKTLGKKINNDFHNIGNTMKNFFCADYLLYPNEYTKNHMVEDYMLQNIAENKIILNGYPRNEAFFNDDRAKEIRKTFSLTDKHVIAYMPTWRGTVANKDKDSQISEVMEYLRDLDERLQENHVMYVNFHPIIHSYIKFNDFNKIKPFPSNIETYEFLNACDTLVTDYSSVFFDFAITGKKIILFVYDKEEYFENRGVYMSIDELPFPKVETVDSLMTEIVGTKRYEDELFKETFCYYDNANASHQLLDLIINNNQEDLVVLDMPNNGKENVLIYAGNFAKNGITSSLMSLLDQIDVTKRNYYVTFFSRRVYLHRSRVLELPLGVNYIPMVGKMNASHREKKLLKKYHNNKINMTEVYNILKKIYTYDIKRKFGSIKFADVIHFTGYEFKMQLLFSFFEKSKKIIYVHSNMVEEIKVRKNQHFETLKYAYNSYDKVALVTDDMRKSTMEIAGQDNNFYVASNLFDYNSVLNLSKEEICFDENTESTLSLEDLSNLLDDKDKVKFINIGRFSLEKGHIRLINAFAKCYAKNPNIYLIIIGGHGIEYEDTLNTIKELDCKDHIVIIKSMSNPFSVLKRCDCFALTSFYEGLGLVILEADILGVPAFTTDILGPRGFMLRNGGYLVGNNEQGIYQGLEDYLNGKVKCMDIDYEEYNRHAVLEFDELIS